MLIVGSMRESFPRVTLALPGISGDLPVEFILDTGFEGDLSLPSSLLRQVDAEPLFLSLRSLADGTVRECPVHELVLDWGGDQRAVQVLGLEHTPLLGVTLLQDCRLDVEFVEGAEVVIELPD